MPSQVDIQGEEKVDSSTLEAMTLPDQEDRAVSHIDLGRFLFQKARESWNQQWKVQAPTKVTKIRRNMFEKNSSNFSHDKIT